MFGLRLLLGFWVLDGGAEEGLLLTTILGVWEEMVGGCAFVGGLADLPSFYRSS